MIILSILAQLNLTALQMLHNDNDRHYNRSLFGIPLAILPPSAKLLLFASMLLTCECLRLILYIFYCSNYNKNTLSLIFLECVFVFIISTFNRSIHCFRQRKGSIQIYIKIVTLQTCILLTTIYLISYHRTTYLGIIMHSFLAVLFGILNGKIIQIRNLSTHSINILQIFYTMIVVTIIITIPQIIYLLYYALLDSIHIAVFYIIIVNILAIVYILLSFMLSEVQENEHADEIIYYTYGIILFVLALPTVLQLVLTTINIDSDSNSIYNSIEWNNLIVLVLTSYGVAYCTFVQLKFNLAYLEVFGVNFIFQFNFIKHSILLLVNIVYHYAYDKFN